MFPWAQQDRKYRNHSKSSVTSYTEACTEAHGTSPARTNYSPHSVKQTSSTKFKLTTPSSGKCDYNLSPSAESITKSGLMRLITSKQKEDMRRKQRVVVRELEWGEDALRRQVKIKI
jgi:hypothetical protein